jgi:hypothetical protein
MQKYKLAGKKPNIFRKKKNNVPFSCLFAGIYVSLQT